MTRPKVVALQHRRGPAFEFRMGRPPTMTDHFVHVTLDQGMCFGSTRYFATTFSKTPFFFTLFFCLLRKLDDADPRKDHRPSQIHSSRHATSARG